jgi:hypothetical protein
VPDFNFIQSGVSRTYGANVGSSAGTGVNSDSTANTKGSWGEVAAATAFDAAWIEVTLLNSAVLTNILVDIGVGGSGSEQIIIPDLALDGRGFESYTYLFPTFIPRGSRIAARAQASTGTETVEVVVALFSGTLLSGGCGPSQVAAYGDTTGSLGTNVDPGATFDTKGPWVEITAATSRAHNWLVVGGRFGDGAIANTRWFVDLAIGGSGSEQIIVADLFVSASAAGDFAHNATRGFPIYVPAGSRIAARASSYSNTDGDRDVWLKVYGV